MKFSKPNLSVLALAVLFSGNCLAQSPANDIDAGRGLFMKNGCYSCHGTVGQGGERGAGPRIAPGPYPFEAFKILVRQPREAMPRFERALAAFKRGLAPLALGLLASTCWLLVRQPPDVLGAGIITACSLALLTFTRCPPVLMIALAGVAGAFMPW